MPLNGVNTPKLFATISMIRDAPELARFAFRAHNRWVSGAHSVTTIESFSGAGASHSHYRPFEYEADHPTVLVGDDHGPTPSELLLHALASCLTAAIANIAAARGITLTDVCSTVEGEMNLLGVLGLSETVRNGYERIRVSFTITGDAPPDALQAVVELARQRSPVFDVLTNGVPVSVVMDSR
jgi:uncharacterized OsmC-like protein